MAGIKNLKDKVVVITGAGSGIGRAAALAFARKGADLVIVDNREDRLKSVEFEVMKTGSRVISRKVDVSVRAQVEKLAKSVIKEKGHVDVLINNAGVVVAGKVEDTDYKNWEWVFGINFWGVLYGVKSFLPFMIERKSGHIVNTSSLSGLCANPATGAYSCTKFAIAALSESLRAELKMHHIGVSTICPGFINTNIMEDGKIGIKESAISNKTNVVNFYKKSWSPDRVAKAMVKAVRRNRSVVPVGPESWIMWYTKRLSVPLYNYFNSLGTKLFT